MDKVMLMCIGIVIYTLSVGPAWWLHCRTGATRWTNVVIEWGYWPIWLAYGFGPRWLANAIVRYIRLWGPWNSDGH